MEFVNGKDNIPYMKWKIKFMFETTKQFSIHGRFPNVSTPVYYNRAVRTSLIGVVRFIIGAVGRQKDLGRQN